MRESQGGGTVTSMWSYSRRGAAGGMAVSPTTAPMAPMNHGLDCTHVDPEHAMKYAPPAPISAPATPPATNFQYRLGPLMPEVYR